MANVQPTNIIYKNQINSIGAALISSRQFISIINADMKLTAQQQLRLVLLECLYIELMQNTNYTEKDLLVPIFSQICDYFYQISLSKTTWIKNYLGFTDQDMKKISLDFSFSCLEKFLREPLFSSLLPYALELLEYSETDLASASKDRRDGIITSKKEKSGIYYTPVDVATYMVEQCINRLLRIINNKKPLSKCQFIDFSCGSGIFLVELLNKIKSVMVIDSVDHYISFIDNSLFAVDISEQAIDCSRYVILSYVVNNTKCEKIDFEKLINTIEKNVIQADATKINTLFSHNANFPKQYDCIIGNPPYVTLNKYNEYRDYGSNLFIPFIYNIAIYSRDESVCSLILPLSFSYNSDRSFKDMRNMIDKDNAEWFFEHYDRSPDSLFGDDVKSRNCVIFRESNGSCRNKYTTGLLRWTSSNRSNFLFSSKQMVKINDISIIDYIPKLNSDIEKVSFVKILPQSDSLIRHLSPGHINMENQVTLKGTAYNWICAFDHTPPGRDKNGNIYVSKELKTFYSDSKDNQYFTLAVLNSTIAFWLWTVIGDGFHVTNKLLQSLGISKNNISDVSYQILVKYGNEYCEKVKQYPTQSINSGKIVTSYNHLPLRHIITCIDTEITNALNLPCDFPEYLCSWYSNIVSCGRP